jgi:capsular exopolysaccharide synthesis family protein
LLREAVDTRIRSGEEIGHMLGLPLLARLPRPAKRLRDEHRPVMLADTGGAEAEAYRVLRTNFELVNLERRARTIMITSSVQGEGKSTTTANLGIALARAGRRVLLIDLDLRDPYLARFFDLEDGPGLTDVALGHVDLEQAIARIALAASGGAVTGSGNGAGRIEGVLEVLPLGPVPPNPGEFTGGRTLAGHLDALRDRADVVLVDSAPMLHVGDALALSALVDALIVVTRVDIVRRPMLVELRRAIDASPAGKLGFVLTGADLEAGYGRGDYRYKEKTYGRRPLDRDRESVS